VVGHLRAVQLVQLLSHRISGDLQEVLLPCGKMGHIGATACGQKVKEISHGSAAADANGVYPHPPWQ